MYEKIKDILRDTLENENDKYLISKFNKLKEHINITYNAYSCPYNFEVNINQVLNNKTEEKCLHVYFYNYDKIKTYDTCKRVSFINYKMYIENIVKLYNNHKINDNCCENSWWTKCPYYFLRCSVEFDPNTLLSSLKSKREKNCDILKTLEKPSASNNLLSTCSSQTDFKESNFFLTCTDNLGDNPKDKKCVGEKIKCFAITASRESAEGSYNLNGESNTLSPPSRSFDQKNAEITEEICQKEGLVKSLAGTCIEPNVRESGTIGAKWDIISPRSISKYSTNSKFIFFRNSDKKSNILNKNIFRAGIAFTLIVGIISTIYIYYEFTPFRRYFHKKVPRKKGIDGYYDDPHICHFSIRAQKSVKRKVGSRRLRFSYYSR
ncbi:PIR Superfamily Protein [Plasmodium malariae]|uniref:PIR Superfamily Protein n=1 Tax=Plasmodium malariae TaxID=5858 RepID=A0A1A8WUJ2_PLAMA|nr:PIR Superfamily Protein [Plasmodium malariae]